MEMMELLKVVLFGIVEGITEWLPISSTGHMILLNEVVSLHVSDEFYSMFQVVIQLGAILAVVLLFFKQIWPFGRIMRNRSQRMEQEPGSKPIFLSSGFVFWCPASLRQLWEYFLMTY